MKIFNLTSILFIGLSLLFLVCITAGYNIYLEKYSKKTFYVLDQHKCEFSELNDLYNYKSRNIKKKDYKKFLSNFDKKSKKEIEFILDTTLLVLNAKELGHKVVKPFTNRQANEIKKYKKFIDSKQILDKSTIKYGNYIFPKFSGTEYVLYNKYGIEKVKRKNKLRNKSIIDAGAYIGDFSVVLTEYTDNKIYAFEPIDENYENLLKTIKLNKMEKKIIPIKMAIGDKIENKKLYVDTDYLYMANSKNGNKKYIVKSITIDEFVKDNNLKVGIIKSNIEGDELKLLKGSEYTIRAQKPLLLISIYHSGKDFFEVKKWIEDLDLGYKFKIIRMKPDDILDAAILIAE